MEKVIDLESQRGINTKIMEENIIKKITPRIEEKVKSEIIRAIVDTLEEQFYPSEEMIREEFIKEVEEAGKRVKEGKSDLLTFEELQKEWKKEHVL